MEPEPERRNVLGVRMAGTIGIAVGIMSVATWWLMYTAGLAPFPPFDLGDLMIRQTPGPIATWTIETLGDRAQPAALGGGLLALQRASGSCLACWSDASRRSTQLADATRPSTDRYRTRPVV